MELLIEFRDDNIPLEKSAAESLAAEIHAAHQPGLSVTVRERRPGFGELGSLAHIWQIAVDLASAAGGTAAVAHVLRPIFKILEKRQEQKIILKGPGFTLQGPAGMLGGRMDELIDHFEEAMKSKQTSKKTRTKRTAPSRGRKKP